MDDKARLNALKKQQYCTPSILKDFNYTLSMPLDASNTAKSQQVLLDPASQSLEAKDTMGKDVRAPLVEFTFEL